MGFPPATSANSGRADQFRWGNIFVGAIANLRSTTVLVFVRRRQQILTLLSGWPLARRLGAGVHAAVGVCALGSGRTCMGICWTDQLAYGGPVAASVTVATKGMAAVPPSAGHETEFYWSGKSLACSGSITCQTAHDLRPTNMALGV